MQSVFTPAPVSAAPATTVACAPADDAPLQDSRDEFGSVFAALSEAQTTGDDRPVDLALATPTPVDGKKASMPGPARQLEQVAIAPTGNSAGTSVEDPPTADLRANGPKPPSDPNCSTHLDQQVESDERETTDAIIVVPQAVPPPPVAPPELLVPSGGASGSGRVTAQPDKLPIAAPSRPQSDGIAIPNQPLVVTSPAKPNGSPAPTAAPAAISGADTASPPAFWHLRTDPTDGAKDPALRPVEVPAPNQPIQNSGEAIGLTPSAATNIAIHRSAPVAAHPALPTDLAPTIAHIAKRDPGEPVEIRLSPEELGRLKIHVWTESDTVRVTVQAERPETLDLLRRNGEALMKEFRAAGFAGGSLDFSSWSGGGSPSSHSAQMVSDGVAELSFDALPTPLPSPLSAPRSGLNLRL